MRIKDVESVRACLPTLCEAARIVGRLIENVAGVRPMPDGTVLLAFNVEEPDFERLLNWGASIEDLELDADFEADHRDLPKAEAFAAPVFSAALLLPPATVEIASLRELPPELAALAQRIADPEPVPERLAA